MDGKERHDQTMTSGHKQLCDIKLPESCEYVNPNSSVKANMKDRGLL